MSLSIIIPHNHKLISIKRCLISITKQIYLPKLETIIIIDKKVFSKKRILNYFSKRFIQLNILVIFNQNNLGVSESRNKGIKKSSNKYLAFLDSDDEWLENKLEMQMKFMENNSLLFTHTSYYRVDKVFNKKKIRSGKKNYNFFAIFLSCKIATPTVILNRCFFDGVLFDKNLSFMEDTDFWINCSKKTNLIGINEFLTKVNVNNNSSYKQLSKFNISYKYIANKHIKNSLLIVVYIIFYNLKILIKNVI